MLLLIGLLSLNIYHVASLGHEWTFSPIYFLTYALIQSTLEVLFLMFIGNAIKIYLPKFFYYAFVSMCFLFFALHYIDFILIRFMDISVYYGLNWILDEKIENFVELLHLTGISIQSWLFILLGTLVVIPLFSMILYKLTGSFMRKPLKVTQKGLAKALFCLPLSLLVLDFVAAPQMSQSDYLCYQRILPWKSTLMGHEKLVIQMENPLKGLEHEKEVLKKVHSVPVSLTKKPNIYLFIVESLREDFITEWTAKNLTLFKEENLTFKKTFSNANCTQDAWYSIFSSRYPFHWAEASKKNKSGSVPLQILKKLGYSIHVYSAAQLNYYKMSSVMFGKNNYLADSYNVYPHYFPVQAWESDKMAIDHFLVDLDKKWAREGNVFIFFIESTHFNYSWPKNYPTYFSPISSEKTHLRVSNSLKNIELIKNRYRNSIHYVDSLFGKVVEKLKKQGRYEEGIILFTGDHGEEFFEEGQLFHASHLSPMQTEPPIYMKLGNNERGRRAKTQSLTFSQVDLFPTVLDYLIGEMPYEVFDGESIFKKKRKPYVISARFNGPRAPSEFFIRDEKQTCVFRFQEKNSLEVLEAKDHEGNLLKSSEREVQDRFSPVLRDLFDY
ncbi:MAG: sulfatase-like hydrolase/transferase [Chlamydiia bacterium]|nr:sulfatase-like hydrolase/transferase [Chlamydiia bacterium]